MPYTQLSKTLPCAKTRSGFTLVEILVVMAIILILAGIVVGVQRGVYRSQSESKAKGEMQAIATALESYKQKYGDYPWVGSDLDGEELYDHLTGEDYMGVSGGSAGPQTRSGSETKRPILDVSQFSVVDSNNFDAANNAILDPWGNPYRYYYKAGTSSTWNYPGFILISVGPDGAMTSDGETTGSIPTRAEDYFTGDNADNLVYGLEF